jgi:hypothetical protein
MLASVFNIPRCAMRFLFLCFLALILSCSVYGFDITVNGGPAAVIVLDKSATITENSAAAELVKYVKEISGVILRVRSTPVNNTNNIYIGQSPATRRMLNIKDWSTIKSDGIAIKSTSNTLVLTGDRPRGSIYAVYTLLEDYLGCKWYTVDTRHIPKTRSISIPDNIKKFHNPPFMSRESYFKDTVLNPDLALKLKLNGNANGVPENLGGHYSIYGWCHTFGQLLPVSEYFDKHPEWFSMIGGQRVNTPAQLCLSNTEMVKELTRRVLAALKENPSYRVISVSQNDNNRSCQCQNCRKLVEKYGSESGPILNVVNQVAAEVYKAYPDVLVETLAYRYTRKAPINIKAADNVIIRLCSIECDYSTSLKSPVNKPFYTDLQEWRNVAKNLYIWEYVVNFYNYHIMHPNFAVFKDNMNIYAQNHVIALFSQGDTNNYDVSFNYLKEWLLAKLMWDPNQDDRALIREFLKGYYGKADKKLYEYISFLESVVKKKKVYMSPYMENNAWLSADEMISAFKLLNQALDQVKSDKVLTERVLTIKYGLQYAWLVSSKQYRQRVVDSSVLDLNTKIAFIDTYREFCNKHKNYFISEGGKIEDAFNLKSSPDGQPATAPEECKGLKADQWVDFQDDDFSLYMDEYYRRVEPDTEASDGSTIWLLCNNIQWSVQKPLLELYADGVELIDLYIRVKPKHKADSGNVLTVGIHDAQHITIPYEFRVKAEDLTEGKYTTVKLGTVDIKGNSALTLFVAPCVIPSGAESVQIDRIFGIIKSRQK